MAEIFSGNAQDKNEFFEKIPQLKYGAFVDAPVNGDKVYFEVIFKKSSILEIRR